jgi:hypothetical protein
MPGHSALSGNQLSALRDLRDYFALFAVKRRLSKRKERKVDAKSAKGV